MKQRSKRTQFPPENETVEWKQSLGAWKEIVETCAAFATASGGTVYVGISPKGGRVGVQIGQGTPPSAKPESQPVSGAQSGVQLGAQSGVQSKMAVLILGGLKKAIMGKAEVAEMLGKSGRTRYLNDLMKKILDSGFVEYTIPDKPNSRLQKYRLTEKGLSLLPREKQ